MSTEFETYQNQVSKLYIAFFGRVPEADGFKFWVDALADGAKVGDLAAGFAGSKEFETVYGDVSAREAVSRFYVNTLNREADPEGLDFWASAVNDRTQFYDIANAIISTAFAGGPGVGPLDQALVENKVIVANYVADTLASNDAALIETALDGVTADPASVQAALARLFALAKPQIQPDQPSDNASVVDGGGGSSTDSGPINPTFTFNTGDVTTGDTVSLSTSGTDTFDVQSSEDFDQLNGGGSLTGLDVINIAQGQTAKFLSTQVTGLTLAVNGQGDGTATFRVDASSDDGETMDLGNATVTNAKSLLTGGDGNDTIVGTNANDTIAGGLGADEMDGGAGADTLDGGAGNDTIKGGGGADTVLASLGSDIVSGGDGIDTYDVSSLDVQQIANFAGVAVNLNTIDILKTTIESNMPSDLASGATHLKAGTSTYLFDINTVTAADIDSLDGVENVVGTDFGDYIYGGGGDSLISGGGGNDLLFGNAGNDTLTGGAGNDTMVGGIGENTFNVDADTDTINDLRNGDVLKVSSGATALVARPATDFVASTATENDNGTVNIAVTTGLDVNMANATVGDAAQDGYTIDASGNADASELIGSAAVDVIRGGAGADTIAGGAGADTIAGGAGSNTYVYNINITEGFSDSAPEVADELTDFDQTQDLIEIRATGVSQFAGVETDFLSLGKANKYEYRVLFDAAGISESVKQVAIDLPTEDTGLTAAEAADVTRLLLTGTNSDDTVAGGNGADQFFMLAGDDIVRGDDNDMIDGGDGEDTVIFTAPVDSANFSDNDLVNVEVISLVGDLSGGVDLSAQTESLVVLGDEDDDTVVMSSGGGTARGKLGKDIFTAGAAKDTFIIHTEAGSGVAAGLNESAVSSFDVINGFDDSEDRLQIVATHVSTFTTAQIIGGASTTLIPDGTAPNNDQVIWIDMNANELLFAGGGADTEGGDVFVYLPGLTLNSAEAAALIELNLTGTAGDDTLSGGGGNDTLSGDAGADTLDGDDGIDTVSYADSDAAVTVTLNGSSNSGGHAQGDVLRNVEILVGSDFDDTLSGNGANNTLVGGLGADKLDGLAGGATTYRYETIADSAAAVSGITRTFDVIPFFDRTDTPDGSADFIDLSAVNTLLTGGTAATSINIVDDAVGGFYDFSDFGEVADYFNNNWNLSGSSSDGLEAIYFEIDAQSAIGGRYLFINNSGASYSADDVMIKLSDGVSHDEDVSPVPANFVL